MVSFMYLVGWKREEEHRTFLHTLLAALSATFPEPASLTMGDFLHKTSISSQYASSIQHSNWWVFSSCNRCLHKLVFSVISKRSMYSYITQVASVQHIVRSSVQHTVAYISSAPPDQLPFLAISFNRLWVWYVNLYGEYFWESLVCIMYIIAE